MVRGGFGARRPAGAASPAHPMARAAMGTGNTSDEAARLFCQRHVNESLTVVVSNYNEAVDWLALLSLPTIVYTHQQNGADRFGARPVRRLPNRGREASAYLAYIVDCYESLPPITAFVMSQRNAWHNGILGPRSEACAPSAYDHDFKEIHHLAIAKSPMRIHDSLPHGDLVHLLHDLDTEVVGRQQYVSLNFNLYTEKNISAWAKDHLLHQLWQEHFAPELGRL